MKSAIGTNVERSKKQNSRSLIPTATEFSDQRSSPVPMNPQNEWAFLSLGILRLNALSSCFLLSYISLSAQAYLFLFPPT